MAVLTRAEIEIAEEVKHLHAQDDALSKVRAKTKVEQREIRLRVGQLIAQVNESSLPMIAERSGYTVARLKDFALVRAQWPAGTFPDDAGYTALEELCRHPDRFSLIAPGMSKRDARAAKGGKIDTPSRWSNQVTADFVTEALRNPEVIRELNARRTARRALLERRMTELEAATPGSKEAQQDMEEAVGLHELTKANLNLRDALSAFAATATAPRQADSAADLLDTAERYVAAIREILTGDGLDAVEAFANSGGIQ